MLSSLKNYFYRAEVNRRLRASSHGATTVTWSSISAKPISFLLNASCMDISAKKLQTWTLQTHRSTEDLNNQNKLKVEWYATCYCACRGNYYYFCLHYHINTLHTQNIAHNIYCTYPSVKTLWNYWTIPTASSYIISKLHPTWVSSVQYLSRC